VFSVDDLMECGLVFRFVEGNLMNFRLLLTLLFCMISSANVFVLVD
jgi:hypothetical protein